MKGGSDKTWKSGAKPEDPKISKKTIIADNEEVKETASEKEGLEAEVLFSQKEMESLQEQVDPEVDNQGEELEEELEEIEAKDDQTENEADLKEEEELSTLFSQAPGADADVASPDPKVKDKKSAAKEKDKDEKDEKEKTRVREAWNSFNDALKDPAGKGNSDAEAAAEAIAKLLEVFFAGIAFNVEAIKHPQQAFRFTKDYAVDNKNDAAKYVQKKVDDAKGVRDTTKKGYKGIVSLIEDLKEYAKKVQAKSKLEAEPFVAATPTNTDAPPKMAIGAHRAPPEKVKTAIGAHRAPPEKVKEPIVLSAHREAPEAEVPTAERPITLSSHREKPELNEENPAVVDASFDATSETDITSEEPTSTEPQTETLETLETDFSETEEEIDAEIPETEFSEISEDLQSEISEELESEELETEAVSEKVEEAETAVGSDVPMEAVTADVSPTETWQKAQADKASPSENRQKVVQFIENKVNELYGTTGQIMTGVKDAADHPEIPLSDDGRSNDEVILEALIAAKKCAEAGIGLQRVAQACIMDNNFAKQYASGVQLPIASEPQDLVGDKQPSATIIRQDTNWTTAKPTRKDFGIVPPTPLATEPEGASASEPSASSEATPTVEEPKRSGGMGSGGKK